MSDHDDVEGDIEQIQTAALRKFEEEQANAPVSEPTSEDVGRGLKGLFRRRAPGLPKAPIAVVIMPGNPTMPQFNAEARMPLALDAALAEAGFPIVRYDYSGQGMNKDCRGGEATQEEDINFEDSCVFLDKAKEMGERLAILCWNYSGTSAGGMTTPGHKYYRPEVCAMMSLCFGYKQWELCLRLFKHLGPEMSQMTANKIRGDFENHANVTVPAIYIIGSKDKHSSLEDLQRIVNGRKDLASGAKIHVIDQSDQKLYPPQAFIMHEKEKEVGITCVDWLKDAYAKGLLSN